MKIVYFLKQNKFLSLVLFAYLVSFVTRPQFAAEAFGNSAYYFKEMILIMPMIFLLTVVIDILIPKEVIIKNLGEDSGFKGGILALILGSVSAGPIYAAFPVSKMLLNKGASIGNIVVILSAWAVIKVPMLANEAKFLGAEFMGTRWILTVVSIFIMGTLVSAVVKKEDLPKAQSSSNFVLVNQKYCTGCSLCANMGPMLFEMIDGKAKLKQQPVVPKQKAAVKNIANKCPANAISIP
ncbi:hypothetical protein SANA_02660 [Gottschalkiaceae bacterium SANA]|nr:hypothetical protein SANA_02660 [Gottschalkiaceae bacterium SANA]